MSLILAAAGNGTRLGDVGRDTPKALVREPVYGLPILHHLYERLQAVKSPEHIIIVGAKNSIAPDQLAEYTACFPFDQKPEISIVRGEPRGVGFAFLLGIEHAIACGAHPAIISVADTIASSYQALIDDDGAVSIGVTSSTAPPGKVYSSIDRLLEQETLHDHNALMKSSGLNIAGIYRLSSEALPLFVEVFRDELRTKRNGEAQNTKGEYRVSWVWKELQKLGQEIHAVGVGELVEVNFSEDLSRFREFFLRSPRSEISERESSVTI